MMLCAGILQPKECLEGFSNKGMITVALLFLVSEGVRRSGILERIILNNTTNNEAKINVVLFEKKDENDKRPNTTAIYVRPVFIDGQWHLTPRDNITESVKDDPVEEAVERKAAAEELANEED